MTMLPDVDETSYREYQADQFKTSSNNRIDSLGFNADASARIAELDRLYAPTPPVQWDADIPLTDQNKSWQAQARDQPINDTHQPDMVYRPQGADEPFTQYGGPAVPQDQTRIQPQTVSGTYAGSMADSNSPSSPPTVSSSPTPDASAPAFPDSSTITTATLQPPIAASPISPPAAVSTPAAPASSGGDNSDYVAMALNAADRAGIDRNVFLAQMNQESGLQPYNPDGSVKVSPAGARGIAQFMPGTAKGLGINPDDPRQALDAAATYFASLLKQNGNDVTKALAAYNAGQGNVDKYGGVPPFKETQAYVSNIMGRVASEAQTNDQGQYVPGQTESLGRTGDAIQQAYLNKPPANDISQFGDPQLTSDEAYSACGPAAAVRFAEQFGRNPTLREAVDLAKQVGWTPQQGMAGLTSEKALMDKLQVPTKIVNGADWSTFAKEAQTGNPVTISTSGHYFFADGYNADTGAFHVGRSGLDLKGGAEWMTPTQMTTLMGAVQGGLLADNPSVPTPSTADQQSNPFDWLGRQKDAFLGSLQQPATIPSQGQAVGSDSLTNPLGTGNLAPQAPTAGQPAQQGPLDVVKQKFSDAIDALGGILTPNFSDPSRSMFGNNPVPTTQQPSTVGLANTELLSGKARRDVGNYLNQQADTQPLGPLIPPVVQSSVLRGASGLLSGMGPLDAGAVIQQVAQKQSNGEPLTDADRQAFDQARVVVGGMAAPLGAEGGFNRAGSAAQGSAELAAARQAVADLAARYPQMSPGSLAASGPGKRLAALEARAADARQLSEAGPTLEPEVAATLPPGSGPLAPPLPEQPAVSALQGLINEAKARGIDTSSIEAQLPRASEPPITADMVTGSTPPPAPPRPPTPPTGGSGEPPELFTSSGDPVPTRTGITPETVQAAHERIDRAPGFDVGNPRNYDAHEQLDTMLARGATPDQIARFLYGTVEGKAPTWTSLLRTDRTGSMAGGLTTEGKVLLGPIIQTVMRAPVGAIEALVKGNPGNIRAGLQGGISGLAEGAVEGLQTLRYGINYRSALAGSAGGGYGHAPGLDVMGSNVAQRAAGTALMGLVRTHGAIADVSASVGRGAARATGANPEQAVEAGQQWALRSGKYGTIGQFVSDKIGDLRKVNPAMDVVGQVLVPFYRVGYNVLTQGVERSPVGLAGTAADVARARLPASVPEWLRGPYAAGGNANGAVTPVGTRLANNMLGVGLAAVGLAQASSGNITGDHPPTGDPRWSIRVPETAKLGPFESLARRDRNGNLWLPIRTLGPAGEAIAQSAILYESIRDGKSDIAEQASRSAASYVGHVSDESFLSGIANIISLTDDAKNLYSSSAYQAKQAGQDLAYQATSLGKSFIPQEKLAEQLSSAFGTYTGPASKTASTSATSQPVAPARTPVPTVTRRYVPPGRATATPRTRP